jgi:hypothetical protein
LRQWGFEKPILMLRRTKSGGAGGLVFVYSASVQADRAKNPLQFGSIFGIDPNGGLIFRPGSAMGNMFASAA